MGSNQSGDIFSKYIVPGLQTLVGGVSEIIAPGNPIGIGLMGSGVGSLAGGAAGGSQGQALGGMAGGLLGGTGGDLSSLTGALAQGANSGLPIADAAGNQVASGVAQQLAQGFLNNGSAGPMPTSTSSGSLAKLLSPSNIQDFTKILQDMGSLVQQNKTQPAQASANPQRPAGGGQMFNPESSKINAAAPMSGINNSLQAILSNSSPQLQQLLKLLASKGA